MEIKEGGVRDGQRKRKPIMSEGGREGGDLLIGEEGDIFIGWEEVD